MWRLSEGTFSLGGCVESVSLLVTTFSGEVRLLGVKVELVTGSSSTKKCVK